MCSLSGYSTDKTNDHFRTNAKSLINRNILIRNSLNYSVIIVLIIFFTGVFLSSGIGALEAVSPDWSTYHGYNMDFIDVSDEGYILGMTQEGTIFFLDQESQFISSWSREEQVPGSLTFSTRGFEALALYQDGYITLFTHDQEDGQQPWAYSIADLNYENAAVSSDGQRIAVSSRPTEEIAGENWYKQSILWVFNREGEQLFNREVDSRILLLDLNDSNWLAAGGEQIGTPENPRGKKAVYVFDEHGYLVWDYSLEGSPKHVGFAGSSQNERVAVLTENDRFYLFNKDGELIWSQEDVQNAVWDRGPYIAAETAGNVLLWNIEGDIIWRHETAYSKLLEVNSEGITAAADENEVIVRSRLGEELFSYRADEKIQSLSLSSSGDYFTLGSNLINFFKLEN